MKGWKRFMEWPERSKVYMVKNAEAEVLQHMPVAIKG